MSDLQPAYKDASDHAPLRFPTQRPDERVVLLLRAHWTQIIRDVLQLIITISIPPIVSVVVATFTDFSFVPGTLSFILIVEAVVMYYLFCFLAYFHDFVDYHLDIWVVTDQRIVSIEQQGLFQRVISEVSILRIQDVTSEVKGKVRTILDFGDVYIQNAGQQERFVFEAVPHPSQVARVVLQVHERALKMRDMEQMQEEAAFEHQLNREAGSRNGRAQQIKIDTLTSPRHDDQIDGL